jgi:hypothetical protein
MEFVPLPRKTGLMVYMAAYTGAEHVGSLTILVTAVMALKGTSETNIPFV